MIELLGRFFSIGLQGNHILEAAILAGSFPGAIGGIPDNLVFDGVNASRHASAFGFTVPEVDSLLRQAGLADFREALHAQHKGWRIGKLEHVFCPWDVLDFIAAHMGEKKQPVPYLDLALPGRGIRRAVRERTRGPRKGHP